MSEARTRTRIANASPPTDRVVKVMELLARSAPKPLTLADVATRLTLSKSTCSALLTQLVRAGWVLRNDSRSQQTYTMGPGVMPLGRAAESGYPPTRDAVAEMRE